jgi:hypothetical protein
VRRIADIAGHVSMWLTLAFPACVLVVSALSCQRINTLSPLRHSDALPPFEDGHRRTTSRFDGGRGRRGQGRGLMGAVLKE